MQQSQSPLQPAGFPAIANTLTSSEMRASINNQAEEGKENRSAPFQTSVGSPFFSLFTPPFEHTMALTTPVGNSETPPISPPAATTWATPKVGAEAQISLVNLFSV